MDKNTKRSFKKQIQLLLTFDPVKALILFLCFYYAKNDWFFLYLDFICIFNHIIVLILMFCFVQPLSLLSAVSKGLWKKFLQLTKIFVFLFSFYFVIFKNVWFLFAHHFLNLFYTLIFITMTTFYNNIIIIHIVYCNSESIFLILFSRSFD